VGFAAIARTAGADADVPTYKLGLDLPLSGIDGASAIPARNAVVLALEEANARGFPGGARVALSDLDDSVQGKHDPAQGAQNLKAFVADPAVLAVVGPMNSNVAKAEIPIGNAAGLAQISMAATAIELTRGPDAVKLRPAMPGRPAFFRVCASDDRQGAAAATFAYARGLRRVFVVDDNESYGKGLADVFAAAFSATGGVVLGREHLTSFALDYKALLTKIRATGPDALFFGGIVGTGGGILRKQMADVGLGAIAYLGGDGLASPEFVPLAGAAAENTYFTLVTPDTQRLPAARAFVSAYRRRFAAEPGSYSAGAYAAAAVALEAVRRTLAADPHAALTRERVLAAVATTKELLTPVGSVTFDARGDLLHPVISLYRVHAGRTLFVDQRAVGAPSLRQRRTPASRRNAGFTPRKAHAKARPRP